jgi:hypothetical protein
MISAATLVICVVFIVYFFTKDWIGLKRQQLPVVTGGPL